MNSVHASIKYSLSLWARSSIIFPSDFRGRGTEASIKMALSRLVKTGELKRLTHGIYYLPIMDPVLGEMLPSPEGVAIELADREKIRIRLAGSFALNKLGLSTQVPFQMDLLLQN